TGAVKKAIDPQILEFAGLKFPVARWGVLVILLVQLYFWLLVRELNAKINPTEAPGLDVAWIGVFARRSARFTFLSSLFAPTAGIAVLTYQVVFAWYQFVPCLLSLSLAVLTCVQMSRLTNTSQ